MADLEGLEITKGEVKHWSGVTQEQVYQSATLKKLVWEVLKTLIIGIILFLSYLIWVFIFPQFSISLILINLSLFIILVIQDARKIFIFVTRPELIKIFTQLDQYNSLVKALEIYNQLEAAGNIETKIENQEALIESLQIIRSELIRALKTEHILKKNKKFIEEHQELFDPNLIALTVLQTEEPNHQQGKLLYQAFQLAAAVHEQLKQLQEQQTSR